MVLAVCNVNRSVGTIWDKSFGLDFFYKIIEAPNDVTIRHFSQVVLLFAIYGKLKKFKLKRSSCAGGFFYIKARYQFYFSAMNEATLLVVASVKPIEM